MQIDTSSKLSNNSQLNESAWDRAIKDAKEEILLLEKKKAQLQRALRIFLSNKRDGVQWPGSETPKHDGQGK